MPAMTDLLETQISQALEAYFAAVALQKHEDAALRPPLRPHFEALDRLAAGLNESSNPRLRHFMIQKSYEKARDLLRS